MNLKLKKLTPKQIKTIYREFMIEDFPANERKPLTIILKELKKGNYECAGLFRDEELMGYCFTVKHGKDYLIDYLAVVKEVRNAGIGSDMLRLLAGYYQDADSIIAEVEDPSFAENEQDRNLQERRLQFYMKNGLMNTGVRTLTFGVHFLLIEMAVGKRHSAQEIRDLYQYHFHHMLPAVICRRMVKIEKI